MKQGYDFHPSILRAYDIRGILGETLSDEDAYYIGRSYGSFIADGSSRRVCVGFDGRLSSPALEEKLVRGLQECGVDVIRVGLGPTPMLYFAVNFLKADGGIMITGSHNPPTHNGFKMMKSKLPLFGEEILRLGKIAAEGEFVNGAGSVDFEDIRDEYIKHLADTFANNKELSVAWDPGNGAAGQITRDLSKNIGGTHYLINDKIDGTFPAHHPDPSDAKNMQQLIALVKQENCDLGIAFDGDGDRIGVIDNNGNMVNGDQLMAIFATDALKEHNGGTVIADVKASQMLFDVVEQNGGNGIMWKTGHSHIKTKMAEENAVFAGEVSGHIFFRDNFGFDDGPYAAVKLLNIVASSDKTLSDIIDQLPKAYSTAEIRVHVLEENKFKIVENIKNKAHDLGANINDIDGVRALMAEGWFLVRASNTEAALVMRCEASNEADLAILQDRVFGLLKDEGVKV